MVSMTGSDTDVPGCARFVHRILKGGSECSMDNLICGWLEMPECR